MGMKKSSNVYWLDPRELRGLGVEVNRMTRNNCFQHCPERGHLPLQKRQQLYDELEVAMRKPGFWRNDSAIEIALNREPYGPDTKKRGQVHFWLRA